MKFSVGALLLVVSSVAHLNAAQNPTKGVEEHRYRIAASDVLVVKYRYSPEYDYTVAVPPDGTVSLPIVGEIDVRGLTIAEAHDVILQKASERLREPEITLELKEFQKPRFVIGGEVGKPGEFELRGRVSLLEAIAIAGGFKSSAKHSEVVLFRRYDADHMFTRVLNAKHLATGSSQEDDVVLQPGDFLFVPQNRISKILNVVPLATLGLFFGSMVYY
jgi:polysaccharide export outer membrane protein